jgi:hypothetical protein
MQETLFFANLFQLFLLIKALAGFLCRQKPQQPQLLHIPLTRFTYKRFRQSNDDNDLREILNTSRGNFPLKIFLARKKKAEVKNKLKKESQSTEGKV